MLTFAFLLIFTVLLYYFLIIAYTIGWLQLPRFKTNNDHPMGVTIIIPARNEADHIETLLLRLSQQTYPKNCLEIIVANDHSEDNTAQQVENAIQQLPETNIRLLDVTGFGKKSALSEAIEKSRNELIITTDADCLPASNEWIATVVSTFDNDTQMVSAPVAFTSKRSLFHQMQSLEFLTLIISAAGAIGLKMPFMCNGANIAFRKSAFTATQGFTNDRFTSGDDVFLLERILQRYGADAVRFAKSRKAIVTTDPMPTLHALLQQRIRWSGKSVGYKNPVSIITSLLVFLNALAMLIALIAGLWHPLFLQLFAAFLIAKSLIDLPACHLITRFAKRKSLMTIYLPLQILYPFYICYVAIASFIVKPTWKGRKIQ